MPLFPNYLFVRLKLSSEEFFYARWCPGVSRIVSFNGVPAPIDRRVVELLMQQVNREGVIEARPKLTRGQEVRIIEGPFDGLLGMLLEAPDAKGRVKVLMSLLNREIEVELPVHLVTGAWVPPGSRDQAETARAVRPILPNRQQSFGKDLVCAFASDAVGSTAIDCATRG